MQSIIDSATGTTEFQYSKTGHLTYAKFGNGTVHHRTADKVGNLFDSPNKKDRTYNYRNRLEKKGNWHYKYDDVGNLIEKYKKKKGLFESKTQHWKYKWNDAGMLQEVIRPDKEKVSFKYDPLGRRISKVFKKTTTCWVWNGHVPLHEWKQYQQRHYTDEGIRADKIVKHHKITWIFDKGSFIPSGKIKDNKKFSILANHLGTPTQMYDEEGEQVWERSLDLNGKVINGSNAPCPFLYQGQYYDKEIELAYNRFRYYDPDDGRYISKDPIGLLSGEYGFYNYVGDSNSWVDPFGLDFMDMVASSIQRTGRKFQGAEIYKFIKKAKGDSFNFKKGDYFYLDNLHKDHFETFSKNDSSKGVYNLDGSKNVDKTKKASNRKGPSCG
ncbi:RHS repeat-associated core domain-containing protein [Tenacibaculum maritimum]|uniref:RHS repeat domain-containing protein n=1 Tax=Tenacibaculum maritimum TaxID=107401 RepID=UPI0038762858